VYICKKCNKEIEKPKTRLWRKYCPMDHRLLRDAVVQSFWGSFARTFGITLFLLFWAISALVAGPEFVGGAAGAAQRREYMKVAPYVLGFVLFTASLSGLLAFREGNRWRKRGGAVERLIPRARGRGFGCLSAAGLMTIFVLPVIWIARTGLG
jgi:hypothetical protein